MTMRAVSAFTLAVLCAGNARGVGHALECPASAPAEWGATPGTLNTVQVISAKRDEAIDETAPPDLVPDDQRTQGGILHSVWKMNSEGPNWVFQVWCHYAGTKRMLKLDASAVKRCEYTTSSAYPDRPPQQMVCD
jgi:hypothetical protein